MSSYKVVSRNPITGLQVKKRVYPSQREFDLYAPDTIRRYRKHHDVDTFILIELENDPDNPHWVIEAHYPPLCEKKCSPDCYCYRKDGTCNA